jgi:phage shock protein PspC (stress-responsive transcriptional regulator)
MDAPYARDRAHGKILGVCSGVARSIGYNPLAIRLLAVLALLFFGPMAAEMKM